MSEKFEKKYKAILNDRRALIEKRQALVKTVNPLMEAAVKDNYVTVMGWMQVLEDLEFIESRIEKHSIVEMNLVRDLLNQCGPTVVKHLNDGDGFESVDDFVKRVDELTTEYITKLTPIVSNKRIMNLISEANWLGVRETMCKIHVNSLSGKAMHQPIDHFKSNWFMGGGKKKDE